jgi:hypothetical protein
MRLPGVSAFDHPSMSDTSMAADWDAEGAAADADV